MWSRSFLSTWMKKKYIYCSFLLLLYGNAVTTFQASIGSNTESSVNKAVPELNDDASMQFIRPLGSSKTGLNTGFYKASDLFRAAINESVHPCHDFYEFACGKWIADNDIPPDLTSYGHFSELREKVSLEMKNLFEEQKASTSKSINIVKKIYNICMDIDKINKLKSSHLLTKLEQFGYWPILHGDKWNPNTYNLTALLLLMAKSRDTFTFIDFYVALDQRNVSRRLLHFDQSDLGLGKSSREYYLNKTRYKKQMTAYEKYINAKILLLSTDAGENNTAEQIAIDIKEILEFETEFAKILVPEDERRNYSQLYNLHLFSDLSTLFDLVDWNMFFRALMPEDLQNYLYNDPEIIISDPGFFHRLRELLLKTDKRIIVNYLHWRYASTWTSQIDDRYGNIQQEFLKEFLGKQKKSPRWKDCNYFASSHMIYASGAMYVRKHFHLPDREAALEMIHDLRDSFQHMLSTNDWMGNETKEYALEKASNMINLIGFPDFVYNDTALDMYYENFTIEVNDDYAAIVDKWIVWRQYEAFERLIEPVDRTEFGTSSAVVNAFYSAGKNAITVNYGSIGAVIGHEITHGFDDEGSQFDKFGNLKNWKDPETNIRFIERTQCIIDQYSNYEVPDTNLKINGKLTQGENIADNGGIKQAFKAYRSLIKRMGQEENRLPGLDKYTNNQIFFISYAQAWCGKSKPEAAIRQVLTDPHSPMRFRVNGVIVNQPEFSKVFNCPLGSPMNPKKKCAVW